MRKYLDRIKRSAVEISINLAFLVLSVCLYVSASDYPKMARTFPQLILVFMIVLTSLDIAAKILSENSEPAQESAYQESNETGGRRIKFFLTIASMFVFLFLMLIFGFTGGTIVFLLLFAWCLGYRKIRPLIVSSFIITGFLYIIFILIMKSFLPDGLLFDILRG